MPTIRVYSLQPIFMAAAQAARPHRIFQRNIQSPQLGNHTSRTTSDCLPRRLFIYSYCFPSPHLQKLNHKFPPKQMITKAIL